MHTRTLSLKGCTVTVDYDNHLVVTEYPDGSMAPARPHDTDEYRATAQRLGYGDDTWRMTLEHELLHTFVARLLGHEHSIVLWHVAHGDPTRWPPGGRQEEGYTTSVQIWLNTAVMDDMLHTVLESASRLHGLSRREVEHLCRGLLGQETPQPR